MPFYRGNKTLSLLSMTLLYKKMVKKKKSNNVFQLSNPVQFHLIPYSKPGTAEHLEELTTFSQVGGTG